MKYRGRCWKFGDNIPTDQIVRSDRVFLSIDVMKKYVLENYNSDFAENVQPGDILVAGVHFGQSSGRAVAPKAIKATGVGAVVVEYASRLFYRNCFEVGLPLLECPGITKGVNDGDTVSVNIETGIVRNETKYCEFHAKPIDPFLIEMLKDGGLIPMAEKLAGDV
ncbi:3-isopropylmalate dehydratase [Neobacillus niacini]|uniref:LeuD/DmdB family oxidoreductase small subunit n=1 Tax=Neobacillus niacini TaxID=86668 RepID=UPI002FFDDF60